MTRQRKSTEERRTEIAEVALEIIAEEGIRRFTVANISEKVGLAEGTIFRHFDDMDDIVMEAVERLQELLLEGAGGFAAEEVADPLERVKGFLSTRVELIAERPELLKLLFSDDLEKVGPEAAAQQIRTLKRRSMTFILNQFRLAKQEGLITADISAEDLLFVAHGTALATVFSSDDVEAVIGEEPDPAGAMEAFLEVLRG